MATRLALESALHWESTSPDTPWLTQPLGGGQVKTYTWKEALHEARCIASWLKAQDLPEKSHIALMSKNSAWWLIADLAIWMAGHVSIPLYPTLGPETVKYTLEHSESKLLFVGKLDVWAEAKPGVPEGLKMIGMPLSPKDDDYSYDWDTLVKENEPLQDVATWTADDVATLVYTSGTTGNPKGAMLSFGAMAVAAEGVGKVLATRPGDRMLSYLPLSHVFERWVVEMGSLAAGFHVFFAESLDTFAQDLQRARPTLFVSVPRLWLKFQQGVHKKMEPEKLALLLKIPIVKGIIKKKVLGALGLDEVRFAGSGSAPIPGELIDWYRALGLELLEGYGMTENFCYSHVTMPGQVRVGYVGSTYPGVECRISEEGEIQIKSPANMLGYYKEPEKTKDAFTDDRWLKTGDRGEIDGQGRLRITGRVKELFKTSKGKYVAPAPIENQILVHPEIEAACVTGSGHPSACALVMPSPEGREKLASGDRDELVGELESLLGEINGRVDHHEKLAFLAVVPEDWTIENGFLTPTMKLKRAMIEDTYGPKMASWFDEKKKVLFA